MSAAITIRQLNIGDWTLFSALRLEALKKCPGVFSSNFEKEKQYSAEEWKKWLEPGGQYIFGLFDEDRMIGITGVATYKENPKMGIFWGSYIQPEYRGRGLSQLLYKSRIDCAIGYKPWQKLIVSHRVENKASRCANQKWGFRLTHKTNKTWPDGGVADEYQYELDLEMLRQKA